MPLLSMKTAVTRTERGNPEIVYGPGYRVTIEEALKGEYFTCLLKHNSSALLYPVFIITQPRKFIFARRISSFVHTIWRISTQ